MSIEDIDARAALPDFTVEERSYIFAVGPHDNEDGGLYRTLSSAAYFLPSIAIGCYGLWDGSFKMLGIGFLTLNVSLIWGFYTEWRSAHLEQTGRAIFAKLRQAMEDRSTAN